MLSLADMNGKEITVRTNHTHSLKIALRLHQKENEREGEQKKQREAEMGKYVCEQTAATSCVAERHNIDSSQHCVTKAHTKSSHCCERCTSKDQAGGEKPNSTRAK